MARSSGAVMRIVGGLWRGRALTAPAGLVTRPTAERMRQAMFDMLAHAPWSPGLADLRVLDAFAGSGALGLEALSRGAAQATFFDVDRAAQTAIRANIAACGAGERATLLSADALRPPRAAMPCNLVFLDPPYADDAVLPAVVALTAAGWLTSDTLIVAETARDAPAFTPEGLRSCLMECLAERAHGAARISFWRARDGSEGA